MADTISALKANMQAYNFDPGMTQRDVFDHLDIVTNGGVNIVDPSNPFVFGLQAATVMMSAFVDRDEALVRKLYARVAQTQDDLYRHMSDKDYIGRFATPAKATFGFIIDKAELVALMQYDTTNNFKKVTIPRNTMITVAGVPFSLQYPIEIRELLHGGLQIVYDTTKTSPLQTLETNVIPWSVSSIQGFEALYFEVDLYQFQIETSTEPVNKTGTNKITIGYSDQFYYARVWTENANGTWTEMLTTHSDQIYDPTKPTAVLRVANQQLVVTIPEIYISSGLVSTTIRTDLYTTLGQINMDMGSYPDGSFTANWLAIDVNDQDAFVAALKNLKTYNIVSHTTTVGGSNELTFAQQRDRVINNSVGVPDIPITMAQAQAKLETDGYSIVQNVDTVTKRVFLATRKLPNPLNEKLITAAAVGIETAIFTLREAALVDTIKDNGTSLTITPDTIFQIINGVTSLVPSETVKAIKSSSLDNQVSLVNNGNYFYTPWHYVLDMSGYEFDLRAYYLDSPMAKTKAFISENDTTGLQVTTDLYAVSRTTTGYKLQITTKSSEAYKALNESDIFVQLAFTPDGERDKAYINGSLVATDPSTKERTFEFILDSNFNVTANDCLEMTGFTMYNTEAKTLGAALTTTFDVLYGTTSQMPSYWNSDNSDKLLGRWLLAESSVGITNERITIHFGDALTSLWRQARTVTTAADYLLWDIDVPMTYTQDVYDTDPTTGSALNITYDDTGAPVLNYKLIHRAGDAVTDATGQPIYLHRKGDVRYDADGNPIIADPRGLARHLDIMLVEGAYWFATDTTATNYRTELVNILVSWIVNDLNLIQKKLLDNTFVYFYPQSGLGNLDIMINNGVQSNIQASQSLQVTLFVGAGVDDNPDLKSKLDTTTIKTISDLLTYAVVSTSTIITALRLQYGSDVMGVVVTGLGGESLNLQTFTVTDETSRCSVRKRLVLQSDNSLMVSEDIGITYIRHEIVPTA